MEETRNAAFGARIGKDTVTQKQMTGSEILLKVLTDLGVDVVFGYPGGAVLPIYDALSQQNHLRHILVRQEGGALHAAEGYARSTGKVGVVLVTSGPGATNCVTGLADALMDSVPVVCLTGQVPTHLIGNDAFQEADTIGITRPCTKHNYLVKDVRDLARIIREAFHVASSGRPGPVVVDLPKDVMTATTGYSRTLGPVQHPSYNPQVKGDHGRISEAVELLAGAKRPLIYAGGGVINSGPAASQLLTNLVNMTGIPTTLTLMGLGALPASSGNFIGMVGMHGSLEANMCMHDCDVMLCVGARFDDRVTGRTDAFSPDSKKNPHRHRCLLDQQEYSGSGARRRRLRLCPRALHQALEVAPGTLRRQGPQRVVGPDRGMARPQVVRLPALRNRHQTAARARGPQ